MAERVHVTTALEQAGCQASRKGPKLVAMYQKILVATDLSEASQPALRSAFGLGQKLGAQVTVVHVSEPAYPANHWFVPHIGDDA